MQLDIADLLGIAAVVLDLLLITKIIFQPAADRIAKMLLVFLLMALGAMIVNHLYFLTQGYRQYPHFAGSMTIFLYSIGPLLYLYVLRLTHGIAPWEQRCWYLHWLLPVAVVVYLLPFYGLSAQEKLVYFQAPPSPMMSRVIGLGHYLQILIYIAVCLKHLRRYQAAILHNFSDIEKINLRWLNSVCFGLVSIILVDFMLPWAGIVSTQLYHIFLTSNAIFIVAIAYSALGHSQLQFSPLADAPTENGQNKEEVKETPGAEKYSRSGLRGDTAQYYLNKLEQLMAAEQCFLDDALSLQGLADRLNLSPHHLSQLLNEELQRTFYDYINDLRVEYAQKLLLEKPELPAVEIAYASGYSNKGTFYTAFKRRLGKTPLQYRRDQGAVVASEEETASP